MRLAWLVRYLALALECEQRVLTALLRGFNPARVKFAELAPKIQASLEKYGYSHLKGALGQVWGRYHHMQKVQFWLNKRTVQYWGPNTKKPVRYYLTNGESGVEYWHQTNGPSRPAENEEEWVNWFRAEAEPWEHRSRERQ
jgi:hypothetical protein